MRKFFLIATAVALVSSFALAQTRIPKSAQGQITDAQAQKCKTKTVVSGGNDMGTYIDAVQQNYGDPCVVVTEPTLKANKY